MIISGSVEIHLYTEQDLNYLYGYKSGTFFKRQGDSLERIEMDELPHGVKKHSETGFLAVVKRLGYSGVSDPIPHAPQLHYCYDVDRKEYFLKIPSHYSQDDFFVVLPEESVPDDALQKCRRLDRIKEDVENGVVDRLLRGHW